MRIRPISKLIRGVSSETDRQKSLTTHQLFRSFTFRQTEPVCGEKCTECRTKRRLCSATHNRGREGVPDWNDKTKERRQTKTAARTRKLEGVT